MQSPEALVVILGTGGTIAGTASDATDHVGYTAGQLGVNRLVAAVPALAGASLEAEQGAPLDVDSLPAADAAWPRVEIVTSHAGSDGAIVRAIVAAGARGIVVAGTGNGSLHRALEAALREAQAAGVRVLRTTRCRDGRVVGGSADAWASADDLTPEKARVDLLLDLLSADASSIRPGSA